VLPRSVSDELYSRSDTLRIFVSSQMRTGGLTVQRRVAAEAVERTAFARAWYWERDVAAGPYFAEEVCVGQARGSDGLILILGSRLTEMTEKEFRAAQANGVPCFIFINQNVRQDARTREFIKAEQSGANTTAKFRTRSELQTQITKAIYTFAVRGWRVDFLGRQASRHAAEVTVDLHARQDR
jgi:hypothetical protein